MQFNYSNCDVQICAEIYWKIFSYNTYKKNIFNYSMFDKKVKKKKKHGPQFCDINNNNGIISK